MDLQRSLLIGAIAVLSFMLLTEWVAFKEARTAPSAQETSRLINGNDNEGQTIQGEVPDFPSSGSAASDEDLPSAPATSIESDAATPTADGSAEENKGLPDTMST